MLLLRHLSSSVWSMRTQKPSEAMVGFSPSIAWCWTIQGFRAQKSLFMSWGVWSSSVPELLWSSCSLMLLYPSQKHCLKSKLHPYFPHPLLVLPPFFFFFLDIGFNENMEKKMWKNLDTDSCFDENSESHKPAHPPPAAHCVLITPDFWRRWGDRLCPAGQRALASWQWGWWTPPHFWPQAPPSAGPCNSPLGLTAKTRGMWVLLQHLFIFQAAGWCAVLKSEVLGKWRSPAQSPSSAKCTVLKQQQGLEN